MPKLLNIEFFEGRTKILPRNNYFGFIYLLISPSGKTYIGQTKEAVVKRWYQYRKLKCKDQPKLFNALNKYGPENFKYIVIDYAKDLQELNSKEIYYIKFLDSINRGYNCQAGGNKNHMTPEICLKISRTKKERNKFRIHNWTGNHHSEKTKKILRKIHLGKKKKPHSLEWKQANSLRMKGTNNHFYGVPFFG